MPEMSRAFRRDEAFYRALFEENPAIKLLLDPEDGRIVDANHAAAEFYGFPREALIGMKIHEINVLTEDEIRAEMENARVGRRRFFRFRHRLASGAIRHVEVHSGPVELQGKAYLLSIIHDVTDRDVFQARLEEAKRFESLGRIAGIVAHDFNNLITVMSANTEVLRRALAKDESLSARVEDVRYALRRATALTGELMAFSKRQATRFETVMLDEIVRDTYGVLARLLAPRIRVELDLASDLPPVRVDSAQMEQVLINLALNARDAMPGGGRLSIGCHEVVAEERDPSGLSPGRWVRLTVADEGEGMTDEVLARAFEPFFTTKPAGKGTGLGLATVHGIVSQTGGQISVETEVAAGTTFRIHLPAATESGEYPLSQFCP